MPRGIFAHFRSHRRLYSCCARCRTSSPCASQLFASAPARPVLPLPARGRRVASPRRRCAPQLRGAPALPAPPAALPLWPTTRSSPPPPLRATSASFDVCPVSSSMLTRAASVAASANLADELSTQPAQSAAIKRAPQAEARRRRKRAAGERAPRSGGGPGAAPPASSEWVGVGVYLSMPVGHALCGCVLRCTRGSSV